MGTWEIYLSDTRWSPIVDLHRFLWSFPPVFVLFYSTRNKHNALRQGMVSFHGGRGVNTSPCDLWLVFTHGEEMWSWGSKPLGHQRYYSSRNVETTQVRTLLCKLNSQSIINWQDQERGQVTDYFLEQPTSNHSSMDGHRSTRWRSGDTRSWRRSWLMYVVTSGFVFRVCCFYFQ